MKIYMDDEVFVEPKVAIGSRYKNNSEYSGLDCDCGNALYIKTPQYKQMYCIACPICKKLGQLYCGKIIKNDN